MRKLKRLMLVIAGVVALLGVGLALTAPAAPRMAKADQSQSGDMSTWSTVNDQVMETIREHHGWHHWHHWHHHHWHHHRDWQEQNVQNDAQPVSQAPVQQQQQQSAPVSQPVTQSAPAAPVQTVSQPAETSAPQPQPSASSTFTTVPGGPDSPCSTVGATQDYTTPSGRYTDHEQCQATSWGNEWRIVTRTSSRTGVTTTWK
jgi:hypothetical protein